MKRQGPIWLGLTERARSLRPYAAHRARSAGWSPARPTPSSTIRPGCWPARWSAWPGLSGRPGAGPVRPRPGALAGLAAWLLMALTFQPMLRFYRRSPLWGLALPADRRALHLVHHPVGDRDLARPGRHVEGPRPGCQCGLKFRLGLPLPTAGLRLRREVRVTARVTIAAANPPQRPWTGGPAWTGVAPLTRRQP